MSSIQTHHIPVQRTARYYTLGEISPNLKEIWIACHGYGMLGQYFIESFKPIANDETLIVAPEALQRFYLTAEYQRIGASWMTREDRLNDIADNVAYLSAVYNHFAQLIDFEKVTVNLFGFSQGTSTAWRLANETNFKFDNLILWAGSIPPEFNLIVQRKTLKLFCVIGDNDEYISQDRVHEFEKVINGINLPVEIIRFEGGHTVAEKPLLELAEKLRAPKA